MHDPRRRRIRVGGFEAPESFMTDRQHPSHRHRADGPNGAPTTDGPPASTDAPTGPADAAAAAEARAEVDRLTAELETAKAHAAELLSALQRERSEFQNFRRRTGEEREREAGLAADYQLKKVLTIADDFDRAIEARPADLAENSWVEGIAAIDRKLRGLLESEGVRPIEAVGKPFDPREHEAITEVPATGRPDGEVIAEVQRGYRVRDRVLRPALVAVAGGGGPTNAPHESSDKHASTDHGNH
jgi:molecular chaperone GrpE